MKEEVLKLLRKGLSYAEIGRRIKISRQAVRVSVLGYKNPKNAEYQKDWRERIKRDNPDEYRRIRKESARTFRKNKKMKQEEELFEMEQQLDIPMKNRFFNQS